MGGGLVPVPDLRGRAVWLCLDRGETLMADGVSGIGSAPFNVGSDIHQQKNGASNLTHYFDKKMLVYKSLKLRGIPTTILVDSQGQVISIHEGIMKWGDDLIVSEIKNLFY